jgi:hypothetical protein
VSNGLAAWHRGTIKPRVRMGIAIGRSQISADVQCENTCRAGLNSALGGYTRRKPFVSRRHNHMLDQLVT